MAVRALALVLALSGCGTTTSTDDSTSVVGAFVVGFTCGLAHGALVQANPDFRFVSLC